MNNKKPTQKEKIETYEKLLHAIHTHAQITCDHDALRQLLSNISSWSYSHRCGNGEYSETEQQRLITDSFYKLTTIKREQK